MPQIQFSGCPITDPNQPANIRGGTILRIEPEGGAKYPTYLFVPDMALQLAERENLKRIATALETLVELTLLERRERAKA